MSDSAGAERQAALVQGATGDWEIVIGIETHAQVSSKAKLFSGASADFGGDPNDHVSLVDAAMPGMLPVINEYCVEQAVRTGTGSQCHDQSPIRVRPEELLLSGPAAGLSDFSQYQAARSSARASVHRRHAEPGSCPAKSGIERTPP